VTQVGDVRLHPVLLAGGLGTRLWPLSRARHPKQLLAVLGPRTLLQETALRVLDPERFAPPVVVLGAEHRYLAAEQLRRIGVEPAALVLEPVARGTAAACTLAALAVAETDPGGLLCVLPVDHLIDDPSALEDAIAAAVPAARRGLLTALAVPARGACTSYGWLRPGAPIAGATDTFEIVRFVEKPDPAQATALRATGEYWWNSGIFVFAADAFLDALGRHAPAVRAAAEDAWTAAARDGHVRTTDAEALARAPAASVDRAVMEHTAHGAMVAAPQLGWHDLGSWAAVWDASPHDADGNANGGDVVSHEVTGSLLRSDGPTLAAIGVQDLIVVATRDVVLVAPRARADEVPALIDRLGADGRDSHLSPPTVHRPWGAYQTRDAGERFQVKRLVVEPGARLSRQLHHHRAEHWIVVCGTALVERGNETFLLQENASTYIPPGTPHRLANPGRIPLQVVEVQTGGYLGEDDIVRFDDAYGRT
jgi:mannose-1-phosphate guanylyltransferase / mannose-6-phosphate isomerase